MNPRVKNLSAALLSERRAVRFDGRVAVVTGGGGGIGAACVRRFAREGAAVVIADVDIESISELANEIEGQGGHALAVTCDVSKTRDVESLFEKTLARFGQVDILVACAGILRLNPIGAVSDDEWASVIDTNLTGTFYCVRAAQAAMAPREQGKIVLLSSGAAAGFSNRIHYSASKAGIEAMVGTLASELGPSNINVNAVAPGFVDTQMPRQHAHWLGEDYAAFSARIAAQVPLRRRGTVEEQAAVITFLCSDDASYVTGQVISVSGGA